MTTHNDTPYVTVGQTVRASKGDTEGSPANRELDELAGYYDIERELGESDDDLRERVQWEIEDQEFAFAEDNPEDESFNA